MFRPRSLASAPVSWLCCHRGAELRRVRIIQISRLEVRLAAVTARSLIEPMREHSGRVIQRILRQDAAGVVGDFLLELFRFEDFGFVAIAEHPPDDFA